MRIDYSITNQKSMTTKLFLTMFIMLASIRNCNNNKESIADKTVLNSTPIANTVKEHDDIVSEKWRTYSNPKLPFTFNYPNYWKVNIPLETIEESGEISNILVTFIDSVRTSTFTISYQINSNGKELFNSIKSQFETKTGWYSGNTRKFIIDGNTVFQVILIDSINGKGQKYYPPIKTTIIDFMDAQMNGEIQIQYKLPLTDLLVEESYFEQVVQSLKFKK